MKGGNKVGGRKWKGKWADVNAGDHHFFLWTPFVVMMMRVAASH